MSEHDAPRLGGSAVKIRVVKDQQFSDFMTGVAQRYPQVAAELEGVTHIPALKPGTIVDEAQIDQRGRASFIRKDYGEPWYLPSGWYEVIE